MERPIIFSGQMARAILDGRKTQTRRPVRPQPPANTERMYPEAGEDFVGQSGRWYAEYLNAGRQWTDGALFCCPYGKPGDRLWLRETCRGVERECDGCDGVEYLADGAFLPGENTEYGANLWWDLAHYAGKHSAVVPSIHMPRWASRLTLEVVSVRVERVQDITEDDARAEGLPRYPTERVGNGGWIDWPSPIGWFHAVWHDIYEAKGYGWDANPWVWVVEFRVVEERKGAE